MPVTDGFELDYDEAWASGSVLLGVGDDLSAQGRAGLLLGSGAYGGAPLSAAAERFTARFGHTLRGLGEEVVTAGENIRASVTASRETDLLAPTLFPSTAPAYAL
ncbi:hypothetical protein ICW40_09220 [Actinotalea ferrariae]|uniref:hypothetical protein n=1 Tax=Actinotalea ferrariae TaxID=1386098 RepID=UPI001C8BAFB3|nr:hypothetical protein [Actinotalea ferrariae]MBX9244989.1 hypothetical protein [Actinotalea ferrariae]